MNSAVSYPSTANKDIVLRLILRLTKKKKIVVPFMKLVSGGGKGDNAERDEYAKWCF